MWIFSLTNGLKTEKQSGNTKLNRDETLARQTPHYAHLAISEVVPNVM